MSHSRTASNMHITLTPGRILGATIVVLSAWIVHGFIEALLAACVIAIASWPLYTWVTARLPRRLASASLRHIHLCTDSVGARPHGEHVPGRELPQWLRIAEASDSRSSCLASCFSKAHPSLTT